MDHRDAIQGKIEMASKVWAVVGLYMHHESGDEVFSRVDIVVEDFQASTTWPPIQNALGRPKHPSTISLSNIGDTHQRVGLVIMGIDGLGTNSTQFQHFYRTTRPLQITLVFVYNVLAISAPPLTSLHRLAFSEYYFGTFDLGILVQNITTERNDDDYQELLDRLEGGQMARLGVGLAQEVMALWGNRGRNQAMRGWNAGLLE
ncbi:MAG: hypothetical protein Q9168_002248 [Polycauliona sp. 1 TL-2023]